MSSIVSFKRQHFKSQASVRPAVVSSSQVRIGITQVNGCHHSWLSTYYSDEHVETVLKRCAATGTSPGKTMIYLVWFRGSTLIEEAHPVENGFFRLKFRRDRRPSLPMESAWAFYPKYWSETVWKQIQWISLYLKYYRILKKVMSDRRLSGYTDLAITPVTDDEVETRELFQSAEAQAYLVKIQRTEALRHGVSA